MIWFSSSSSISEFWCRDKGRHAWERLLKENKKYNLLAMWRDEQEGAIKVTLNYWFWVKERKASLVEMGTTMIPVPKPPADNRTKYNKMQKKKKRLFGFSLSSSPFQILLFPVGNTGHTQFWNREWEQGDKFMLKSYSVSEPKS